MIKQESKLAFSALSRLPGFSLTVILTLALTLAALTVVININHFLLTKPLPYPDADKLWVTDQSETINGETQYGFQMLPTQYHIYNDTQFIDTMALMHLVSPRLMDAPERPRVDMLRVSPEFFSLLGIRMHKGRALNENEGVSDEQKVLVLTYEAWLSKFNADPNIIGSYTQLNQTAYQIIGIAEPDFEIPEIFGGFPIAGFSSFPTALSTTTNWDSISSVFNGIARLKAGVNISQVNQVLGEQINTLYQSREGVAPDTSIGARFTPLKDKIIAQSDELAISLLFSAGILVLIAITNVTNLFLSRAAQKQRTMAIQAALGAKPKHIFVSMLFETSILVGIATALGLLSAEWINVWLKADLGYLFSRMQQLSLDWPTIVVSLIFSAIVAVLIAWLTSRQVNYHALTDTLHASGKGTGAQISARTRHVLVALQVTFATLLIFLAANKLIPAYQQMTHPTGFDTQQLYFARIDDSGTDIERYELSKQIKDQLSQLSSITSVSASHASPLVMGWENYLFDAQAELIGIVSVSFWDETGFDTIGLPIQQGRTFSPIDQSGADNNEIIISASLAKRLYGDELAIWKTLHADREEPRQVVGVVSDMYVPRGDRGYTLERYYLPVPTGASNYIIKAKGELNKSQLEAALKQIHPSLNVAQLRAVDDMLSQRLRQTWLQAMLTVGLLILTLSLAGAGIYGVLNYSVQMRRYELGIHLSLGAHTQTILQMILKQSLIPVASGMAASAVIGLIGYLAWSRFSVQEVTFSWLSIAIAMLVMLFVALLACYLPARKVIAQDPIRALRNE
ncbi:FtsX-like permease family protein [Pseudoalteromonas sp. T1lg65]|uniref:FtsX-like permease family protein n=1 Tax=Pseudoalteromonas sp. T1lg65 TaxID=2077101 RepID=UPI003F7A4C70